MEDNRKKLTRRSFLITGSAALAAPLIIDAAVSPLPAVAEAAQKKSVGTEKLYYIGHDCVGCQTCRMMCPADAIDYGDSRNEIDQEKCIHCGTCYEECPISVISETG